MNNNSKSNVTYDENDKKKNELNEFIKEQETKSKFIADVKKLLKKYNYNKDYLTFAYDHIECERGLYTISIPTYKNGIYDGDISILVSGTKEEIEKFKTLFYKKVKDQYEKDKESELTFPEESYHYKNKILSLHEYLKKYYE